MTILSTEILDAAIALDRGNAEPMEALRIRLRTAPDPRIIDYVYNAAGRAHLTVADLSDFLSKPLSGTFLLGLHREALANGGWL